MTVQLRRPVLPIWIRRRTFRPRSIAVHPGMPQGITGLSRFCALIGNRAQLVFHVQGRVVDPLAINCECMPGFARAL